MVNWAKEYLQNYCWQLNQNEESAQTVVFKNLTKTSTGNILSI